MQHDCGIVVVAGGTGTRLGAQIPKQFLELNQSSILVHTLQTIVSFDIFGSVVLVIHPDWRLLAEQQLEEAGLSGSIIVTNGGITRFQSVKNGLQLIKESYVAIHDAVRPFITQSFIENGLKTVLAFKSAIPVLTIKDSLRTGNFNTSKSVDRNQFFTVQTPQFFQRDLLLTAFDQEESSTFTDDASVWEAKHVESIHLFEGLPQNIKITTPTDLQWAKWYALEVNI